VSWFDQSCTHRASKELGFPVAHPSFLNPPQPNGSGFYTFLFSLRILINLCTGWVGGYIRSLELFIRLGQILSKISPRLSLSRYCIYIYLFVLALKKLVCLRKFQNQLIDLLYSIVSLKLALVQKLGHIFLVYTEISNGHPIHKS